ncbi:E3 ubiquitin-protein ligase TRIM33 [Anopheles moucheti]|uniref:E3 ubiquitin-protein ligase TRIM33 n=1 Tax=Anopheles moucheti TaxID=186751 RepID=UPI0022F0D6E3|nr:E3 ubiquitin-protein ligase TRIM33 [Anopheles moucheti]
MTLAEMYSFSTSKSGGSANGSGSSLVSSATTSSGGSSTVSTSSVAGEVTVSSTSASIGSTIQSMVVSVAAASPELVVGVAERTIASGVPAVSSATASSTTLTSSTAVAILQQTVPTSVAVLVSPRSDQLVSKLIGGPSPNSSSSVCSNGSSTSSSMFPEVFKLDDMLDLENVGNSSLSENGSSGGDFQLDNSSLSDLMEQDCTLCKNKFTSPRVLSCLHVFCESCLDKLLADSSGDKILEGGNGSTIVCTICKQSTPIGPKGAAGLHQDYILSNVLDLSTIEPALLACTSCKSKEMAISRCNDCANFLCDSCEYAHQHMRCFEDHKVVQLEDLRKSSEKVAIHKPLYCPVHATENLKYYCFNCSTPVCNECLIGEHKGNDHTYHIISEAEKPMRQELECSMRDAKSKIECCNQATAKLESSLHELQSQYETARGLITESFQSFKAVLEKCREDALKNLEKLHSERELKIMDLYDNVAKSVEKIEVATKYARKVLDQANGPELLSLKSMICAQLSQVMGTAPKGDVKFSIEFQSNYEKFQQLVPELFGKFRTESCLPGNMNETTPSPTLPGVPMMVSEAHHQPGNGNCGLSQGPLTASVTASSPISLPTSMQSSFDGDISTLGPGYILPNVLTPEPATGAGTISGASNPLSGTPSPGVVVGSGPPTLPGLSSIAEYNLHRLANLAGESSANDMTDSIVPVVNSNPATVSTAGSTPNFTLADLISGNQHAIQALAKYSSMGGQDMGNGAMLTPHPSLDNVPMMNDFPGVLPGSTSPILPVPPNMPSIDGPGMNGAGSDMAMSRFQPSMCVNGRTKATPMQIRTKFGSLGQTKGQFNSPHGFCLGVDEEIVVADTNNHRIEIFEKNGTFKFSFGVPGKEEGQLFYPRKVAVMRTSAKFVVCDRGNERSRMQIFSKNGHFIKKIAIRYIDIVAGLAVTNKGLIVAVDSVSPTVFIICEDGNLIHWFDCSDFMREPSDIAINGTDFFVCDFKGHCVAVFAEDGTFKYRIGSEKITCFPNGIDISDAGDVLIGDSHGNRFHVACYSKDGHLQSEFECPYVKVSRCCGLKITSEGYVVTLAKNNHHVLVLNTLYIQ